MDHFQSNYSYVMDCNGTLPGRLFTIFDILLGIAAFPEGFPATRYRQTFKDTGPGTETPKRGRNGIHDLDDLGFPLVLGNLHLIFRGLDVKSFKPLFWLLDCPHFCG